MQATLLNQFTRALRMIEFEIALGQDADRNRPVLEIAAEHAQGTLGVLVQGFESRPRPLRSRARRTRAQQIRQHAPRDIADLDLSRREFALFAGCERLLQRDDAHSA